GARREHTPSSTVHLSHVVAVDRPGMGRPTSPPTKDQRNARHKDSNGDAGPSPGQREQLELDLKVVPILRTTTHPRGVEPLEPSGMEPPTPPRDEFARIRCCLFESSKRDQMQERQQLP